VYSQVYIISKNIRCAVFDFFKCSRVKEPRARFSNAKNNSNPPRKKLKIK
jgi:hypothetical protein